jgi:subtilase family serine protease
MKAIDAAVAKYPAGTVFSMSFGTDESAFASPSAAKSQFAKFDATFQRGLAKKDTFFASSGDDGSVGVDRAHHQTATDKDPQVSYPNVSPYVTSVGGTQLQHGWTWAPTSDQPFLADGVTRNPAYWNWTAGGDQQVVWNESWAGIGTGGGLSRIYPRPAYQDSVAGVVGTHRGVPDIAWNAAVNGGVLVYQSFFPSVDRVGWHIVGGTSAATPQVAALTALAVQKAGHGLGNINPLIYGAPSGTFTDVTPAHEGAPGVISGDLISNRMFDYNGDGVPVTWDPVPGWPTTSGYDMTTGFGTPNAPAYVAALAGS